MSLKSVFFLVFLSFLSVATFAKEEIKFYTDSMVLSADETYVIPFQLSEKASEDKTWQTQGDGIEIIKEAKVLKGFDIGFCRIQTKTAGSANLNIANTSLKLTVENSQSVPDILLGKPEIQSPINHSFAWGQIHVGVKVLYDFRKSPIDETSIKLLDQNGKEIPLLDSDHNNKESVSYYRFLLDTDLYQTSSVQLTPICKNQKGKVLTGDPIMLYLTENKTVSSLQRECEDFILPEKRLPRWSKKNPKLGSSPTASNGRFVLNYAADPVNVHEIEIEEPGFYQLMLRAKGDKAAGTYPSVGLYLGQKDMFLTAGRLFSKDWQRTPIGVPVYIEKGTHQIALRFLNDFAVQNRGDRNLYLDSFELQKIENKYQNTLLNLEVAFLNNIHGKVVRGEIDIQGRANWDKSLYKHPPKMNLEINGKTVTSIYAAEPHFIIARNQLRLGTNTLRLSAEFPEDIQKVYSVTQSLLCEDIKPKNETTPYFYDFAILDPIWGNTWQEDLEKKEDYSEIALIKTAKEFMMSLPDTLEGTFYAGLDCRANNLQSAFNLTMIVEGAASIENNKGRITTGWWQFAELGKVTLTSGAKKIKITLDTKHLNDPEKAQLWLRGLFLKRVMPEDETTPFASILYPKQGQAISGSFMVVAKAIDDNKIDNVDAFFDGKALQQVRGNEIGIGYYYFMVPEFINTEGKHQLMILARDREGNIAESETINYTSIKNKDSISDYEKALLLSQRFGYGADQVIIGQILTLGADQWLNQTLAQNNDDPAIQTAFQLSEVLYPDYSNHGFTPFAVILQTIKTGNPAQARFSLWAQNHFSTYLNKTNPLRKRMESNIFFQVGLPTFKKLLLTSATSPAMLFFLDQQNSFVGKYNENYARELMELHTLSVNGGYTQEDVTNLALLLTGWMQSDVADLTGKSKLLCGQFVFEPRLADGRNLRVFGYEFLETQEAQMHDRVQALFEMLAGHPKTAEFITKKLLLHYVGENYSKELHANLQKEFMHSGNLQAILKIISHSNDFFNSRLQPKISAPLDFAIASMRNVEEPDIWQVYNCARNSGVGLFDRITPDGYPETNTFYADANALLQRWRFSETIQWTLYRNLPESLHNRGHFKKDEWQQQMIQVAAMNTMGQPLSPQSYESTKDYFQKLEGPSYQKFLSLTSFINKLPEANNR